MRPQDTAYIIERLAVRFMAMVADHERQLAEHRASFGARTEADAKIIAGLRAERDGLLTQVQDMRAESQTPKHPAKVGEWVRKTTDGLMYKTGEARRLVSYEIIKGEVWCHLEDGASWKMSVCEPCDPPTEATHDTPEGRSVVESVIRNDRKTEPDEIKVGDVAKVRSASGNLTAKCDVGQIGEVLKIDSRDGTVLLSGEAGWVDIQDVRKVTT